MTSFDPYHLWLSIPPSEQPPNHYRLLGLREFEEDISVITNAVDQRTVFVQSKKGEEDRSAVQQLMKEIKEAEITLCDPAKKKAYDARLAQLHAPKPAPQPPVPKPIENDVFTAESLDAFAPIASTSRRPRRGFPGPWASAIVAITALLLVAVAVAVLRQNSASENGRQRSKSGLVDKPKQPARKPDEGQQTATAKRKEPTSPGGWETFVFDSSNVVDFQSASLIDDGVIARSNEGYSFDYFAGADIGIEARVKILDGYQGSLFLRSGSEGYYAFVVRSNGRFLLTTPNKGGGFQNLGYVDMPKLAGKEVLVRFEAKGDLLVCRVNGKVVIETRDAKLKDGIPMIVAFKRGSPPAVSYRNIRLRRTADRDILGPD